VKWTNIWSYTQQDYRSWQSEIENQLQVVHIPSNHYGKSLKIRFSNEYGQEDLNFKQVRVRVLDRKTLKPSETKIVTVNGNEKISIFPTLNLISDALDFEICLGDIIEIETELREKTILRSGTVSYKKERTEVFNYQRINGEKVFMEQEKIFRMVKENNRMFYIYGISGVDFLVSDSAKTIVAFGDSLTQQAFWTEHLKELLFKEKMHDIAVLNRGIGGSRVLKGQNPENDEYTRHGNAGLFRFEKEVFMYGKPDIVICLHGINDLISRGDAKEYPYTAEDIKNGLMQYAQIAHHHGVKIIIGTLTPMGNSIFYSDNSESERQEINKWIRQSDKFDGVFDFDKVLSDTDAEKNVLKKTCDSGDGLHPSAQGGKEMIKAIDLSCFNSRQKSPTSKI